MKHSGDTWNGGLLFLIITHLDKLGIRTPNKFNYNKEQYCGFYYIGVVGYEWQ